jgi:hypothetical protein
VQGVRQLTRFPNYFTPPSPRTAAAPPPRQAVRAFGPYAIALIPPNRPALVVSE